MFQPVLDSLIPFGFTQDELAMFESKLSLTTLRAGDYLLRTGETCRAAYFLLEGSCIHSIESEQEKENVLNLYTAGDWLMDYASFTGQKPSIPSIRTHTETTIASIHMNSIHALIQNTPAFFKAGRLLEKMQYTDVATLHLSPDEKYLHLLTNRPALLQAFPLKIIASYLRLTPETLSRIRARIS